LLIRQRWSTSLRRVATVAGMSDYDVAIIGGGAAGLSAALVLSRARRHVLVVDAGEPRNAPAAHMHGYLSRDGLPPADLIAIGRREVSHYGGQFVHDVATELVPDGRNGFWVLLRGGQRLSVRRLLVATGLRDELPDIPGLRDRWAQDVLHCPYCHGYEVVDRRLGVLGGASGAVRYAQIVRQWTDKLVYFTPPGRVTDAERFELAARGITLTEGVIAQLVIADDRLHGVQLDDGCVVPCDAMFVPPRFVPNNRLLVDLGCAVDPDGWAVTDPAGRTNVSGVWVAGNVADPHAQVITAAGAGSAAAIAINADLVAADVRSAVRDFQHGLVP
jgi:thioredoxin reductase